MPLPDLLIITGRILLGGLFVLGGVKHFTILDPITQVLAARGVPAPRLVLIGGSIFQIIAGTMLMAGLYVPYAAFGLIAFTILASFMMLNFWDMPQGVERDTVFNIFMTNIALIGGLLIAAATGL